MTATRHPRGDAPISMSQQLLTGHAGTQDLTCGYGPLHRLAVWWDSPARNGIQYWRSACGATGYTSSRFGIAADAIAAELCPRPECFAYRAGAA